MSSACLSGLYNTASSVAATGYGNYDIAGVLSAVFFGIRANTVGQTFSRRFSAIDYKIQKQQLHREDIRDLVELTSARMGIYNVVGTLLLTFCVGWYTQNSLVLSSSFPWYLYVILINVFAAVGYLLLSIWLQMYASIAVRSIGTRLLTSYARVSFPTNDQVNQIKVPIFCNSADFSRQEYRKRAAIAKDIEAVGDETFCVRKEDLRKEEEQPDDDQHFRKFLGEMPKFIIYDRFARVCMSFGVNQMLYALGYYILGYVWSTSIVAALLSCFAVQLLTYIILYLDVWGVAERWRDVAAFFCLRVLPAMLAAALLFVDTLQKRSVPGFSSVSGLASLVFFANAGWLYYMFRLMRYAGQKVGRFKPGGFESVLEWVQCDYEKIENGIVDRLDTACQELREHMISIQDSERRKGEVSSQLRSQSGEELYCRASVAYERVATTFAPRRLPGRKDNGKAQVNDVHPVAEMALQLAEFTLERFALWEKTPELLAALEALRGSALQEGLLQGERQEVEDAYSTFLTQSMDLDMGTCLPKDDNELLALRVPAAERYTVRVAANDKPVCISSGSEHAPLDALPTIRTTNFQETIKIVLPQWKMAAANLIRLRQARDSTVNVDGGRDPIRWRRGPETLICEKEDKEPSKVMHCFTFTLVLWWIAAGLCQCFGHFFDGRSYLWASFLGSHSNVSLAYNSVAMLDVEWPAPARLFEVMSLHCDVSHILISGKSAAYTMDPIPSATNRSCLKRVRNESINAVICGLGRCDALRWSADETWQNAFGLRKFHIQEALPLSRSWRLVSGVWADCLHASCASAQIAGWDGASIIVISLKRDSTSGKWVATNQFMVNPSKGLCGPGDLNTIVDCAWRQHLKYKDVKAIQMGGNGRGLVVLFDDGLLDVWDLGTGVVLKRWMLDQNYSSMCIRDGRMFLTREGFDGPEMIAIMVPEVVQPLFHMQRESHELPGDIQKSSGQAFRATRRFAKLEPTHD